MLCPVAFESTYINATQEMNTLNQPNYTVLQFFILLSSHYSNTGSSLFENIVLNLTNAYI